MHMNLGSKVAVSGPLILVAFLLAVPFIGHAQQAIETADASCNPVVTECGCGQVKNSKGQCEQGSNKYMCPCSETVNGQPTSGQCVAADKCLATKTDGKAPQLPSLPQPPAGSSGSASPPPAATPATAPQLSNSSSPSAGSETGPSAGTSDTANTSASNASGVQNSSDDSPSPSPQNVGGDPNGTSVQTVVPGPDLSPDLSSQQAVLEPSDSPPLSNTDSSGNGPTGQASSAFGSDSSFTQTASQPMGNLEGLTNTDAQSANFSAEPTGQQNAENLQAVQNAADNGNGAAQSALEYQSSTNPDGPPQAEDSTQVRATFYTPGSGGDINGGIYGTHDNYLDPSTPTVAAGPSSGLNYGDVVNVANPATGQSINAVVGDACPGCGSGVDLTPITANAVGLSVEQGTAPMDVSVVGQTGSYAAGAQLAASLNSPPDPWSSAPSSPTNSLGSASPGLASAPAGVGDFAGYASAQAYAENAPLPSSSAYADNVPLPQANPYGQSVFNNGSSDSYASAQPYQSASDLPAGEAPTIEENPQTALEPAPTPTSFAQVTGNNPLTEGGLSMGTSADLNPNSVISQPIATNGEAVPVGEVTSSELPPSAEQLQAQSNDELASVPTEQGQAYPAQAVTSENLPPSSEQLQAQANDEVASYPTEQGQPYPAGQVETGPELEQPSPTASIESQSLEPIGPNAEQPSQTALVESQPLEAIGPGAGEAYPTTPVESASLPSSAEQLQAQANDEVTSAQTEQGPANPTQPVTTESLQALDQLTPQERIADAFNTFLQPVNSVEPAFNDPYSLPQGLSGGTSPGDLAFAQPTAGAPDFENTQVPSWANTVVGDMQGAQTAVQNDYQALANEFGASNSQNASENPETQPSAEAPQENAQPIENPPLPQPRPAYQSSYSGSSIVDYLNSAGQDFSYATRAAMAASQGIANYVGSAAQNLQLLKNLRGF